jgi:transposase
MVGQALDKVRKELVRGGADLKGSLWALRGNEWTRSQEQCQQRSALCNRYPKLGRAMGLRDMLQDILADEDQEALRWWCKRAKLSRLEAFRELAESIQQHWSGVVAFLKTRLTNGAIEAVNGLLQLAKRLARFPFPALFPHNGLSQSRRSSSRFAHSQARRCYPLQIANGPRPL